MAVTGQDLFQFYMPIYGHSVGLSASAIGVVLCMRVTINQVTRIIVPVIFGTMGSMPGVAPVFVASSPILSGGAWLNRERK